MILKKMGTASRTPLFGGEPVEFRQATFTLDDGHTLSVSQYTDEYASRLNAEWDAGVRP